MVYYLKLLNTNGPCNMDPVTVLKAPDVIITSSADLINVPFHQKIKLLQHGIYYTSVADTSNFGIIDMKYGVENTQYNEEKDSFYDSIHNKVLSLLREDKLNKLIE